MAAGSVGAAIRSASGATYTGICIDAACGIGFCAEHAAVAEMLKHRESDIVAMASTNRDMSRLQQRFYILIVGYMF